MQIQTIGAERTMSSREIAELVNSTHDSVLKTTRRLIAEGVVFGNETLYTHPQNSQQYPEILMDFRNSLVVASGYSSELRARVIDRWQELEASVQKPAELSRMDILRLAMESEEGRLKAEAALAMAAPKVEFVDRYVSAPTSSMGIREVVKLLKTNGHTVNEHSFTEWLVSSGYMYRKQSSRPDKTGKLTPAAQHEKAGRFETKTGHGANGHTVPVYKFTGKGVSWIVGEWAKHQIFEVAA